MRARLLHQLLEAAARRYPARIAAIEAGATGITYADLDRLADLISEELLAHGVRPGDRVGICLAKSVLSLASIFGILKTGAAYVPVDSTAPAARNGYIF